MSKKIRFQNVNQAGETITTPLGDHKIKLDEQGVGEAPDDSGLFDSQGKSLVGSQYTLLEGKPRVVMGAEGIQVEPGPLVKVIGPRVARAQVVVTPMLGYDVRFSRGEDGSDPYGFCPDNCGLDGIPGYTYSDEKVDEKSIPDELKPRRHEEPKGRGKRGEVSDSSDPELDENLSDEQLDAILESRRLKEMSPGGAPGKYGMPGEPDDLGERRRPDGSPRRPAPNEPAQPGEESDPNELGEPVKPRPPKPDQVTDGIDGLANVDKDRVRDVGGEESLREALGEKTRKELDTLAVRARVQGASEMPNKPAVVEAILAAWNDPNVTHTAKEDRDTLKTALKNLGGQR